MVELTESNLPTSLIPQTEYHAHRVTLKAGTRVLLVTDGVTEAEGEAGAMFGNVRLENALAQSEELEDVFRSLSRFCGNAPSADDCTLAEIDYRGDANKARGRNFY